MKRNTIKWRLACLALLGLMLSLLLTACVPPVSTDDVTTTGGGDEPVVEDTTTTAPNTDEKPAPEPEPEAPSDPYDGDGFPNRPEDDGTKRY